MEKYAIVVELKHHKIFKIFTFQIRYWDSIYNVIQDDKFT
jgi:hypothetical protein